MIGLYQFISYNKNINQSKIRDMKRLFLSAIFAASTFTSNAQRITIITNSSKEYAINTSLNDDGNWNSDTSLLSNNIIVSTYIFDLDNQILTYVNETKKQVDSIFIQNKTGIDNSIDSVFRISINGFSDEYELNITKKTIIIYTNFGYVIYPNSIFYIE